MDSIGPIASSLLLLYNPAFHNFYRDETTTQLHTSQPCNLELVLFFLAIVTARLF
jgi:hypothetical protein